jgi:LPS-assembly protein
VAIGKTDVPFPGRPLTRRGFCVAWVLFALMLAVPAHAAEGEPLHTSGDRQLWHRKENVVELFGHAVVSQPEETLTADYVRMDLGARVLDAKGNCVYVTSGNVIYGDEMHFNLDTRTGTVVGGRVSNSRFTLSGQRINKLGDGRFQTHWGEYSTCIDCPNSWSILAEDVDMQVEGYAFMSNVTPKIDAAPAFWLPYLIVPMKTQRQSGFLFPSFSFGSLNGMQFVLPYFWAINRSADMTIGVGGYTARGPRLELEGRYALSARSGGKANFYFLRDSSFNDGRTPLSPSRFALDIAQTQELPWGFTEKLRLTEVSDNLYPMRIGDVAGSGELNLPSTASINYASSDISGYVAARRYRTLINTNPDVATSILQFDPRTVQGYPVAAVTANDRQLFGLPVAYGLTMGLANFTRSADVFDYDNTPPGPAFGDPPPSNLPYRLGTDPIRKGTRLMVTPTVYTSLRPLDLFSLTPSLKYYYYWYTFPRTEKFKSSDLSVPNLNRSYLQLQVDLSAQLERIYDRPDDKDQPRTKHLIRPLLTYSYIPPAPFLREDPNHPFLQQIKNANTHGKAGYNFDDYDIVPLDNSPLTSNYFIPLGNSLNMGITSQWIRRHGALDSPMARYVKYIDFSVGEAFNHRELENGNNQPFSRFFNTLDLNLGSFSYSHLYYYYPYIPFIKHALTSTINYAFDRGLHQGLYLYDRSMSLTYAFNGPASFHPTTNNLTLSAAYSLSDYFLPTAYASYEFINRRFLGAGATVSFQSPARCWKLSTSVNYDTNQIIKDSESLFNGVRFGVDLAINISGVGFGGVTEIANQVVAPK